MNTIAIAQSTELTGLTTPELRAMLSESLTISARHLMEDDDETKTALVKLSAEEHRLLKIKAAESDSSITHIVRGALWQIGVFTRI